MSGEIFETKGRRNMKAATLYETGGPEKVIIEEKSIRDLKDNEVLIKVKSAALNRRDLFITYGLYPGMKLPCILGADGAGVVVKVGKDVTGIQEGSEVIIDPGLNWGENNDFAQQEFRILGMPSDGTFAQYVIVPSSNVYRKPDHLSFDEAAALPLAGVTAYRALFTRGQVEKGETVLIPGIGSGVAQYLLQMAVSVGANVYVTSSSEEKINRAVMLGAKGGVNYRDENWAKTLKNQMGSANLIVDGVGGPGFNNLIQLTAPGGRIVSYGATNGPVPNCVMPKIFFKNMDILGTTMGSPRDFENMLTLYEKYELQPMIDRTFSLDETKEALMYMGEGKNFGKIVIRIE